MHRRYGTAGTAGVNGALLRYEIAGDGAPLVLVHAGIADGRMWDGQMPAFARHHRVIRYDMRGFGGSAMVEGPYSHHDDLRAFLDFLGVERASFVGCSMGGQTVLDFAPGNPEKVAALVLVAPSVSGFELEDEQPPEEWDDLVSAYAAGDLERVSDLEVRIWVDGPHQGSDAVDPAVRDLVREMDLIALRNEASGLGEERLSGRPAAERLAEVRAPTLVVVGDGDRPRILAVADLLEDGIAGAWKIVMPGVAHLPNMECPRVFERIALDHLEGWP